MTNEPQRSKEFHGACAFTRLVSTPNRMLTYIVAGVLTWLSGCSPLQDDFAPPVERSDTGGVLNVNVVRAQIVERIFRDYACFGTLTPRRSSSLGFTRGGRVVEVLFDVGARVSAGQKIASLEQVQLDSQAAQLGQQITRAKADLSNLERAVRSQANQRRIAQAQQTIATLETQLDAVELEVANGIIAAPYDGIISERHVNVGDSVPVGRPAFKIVDDRRPIVELHLATNIAAQVNPGQAARVVKGGRALDAQVSAKSPELDTVSRTQAVTLTIVGEAVEPRWTLGDAVEVYFSLPSDTTGFWLPTSALQGESNGLWSVFAVVRDGDRQLVQRRTLEVLHLKGDFAVLRGSLNAGDLVIVDGLNRVVPGQEVVSQDVTVRGTGIGPGGRE